MLTDPTNPSQRVGYMDCLIDLDRWLQSQIGRQDTATLEALLAELGRLGDAAKKARPPAPASREPSSIGGEAA